MYQKAIEYNKNINAMIKLYIHYKTKMNYRIMNKYLDMIISNYDKISDDICTKENVDKMLYDCIICYDSKTCVEYICRCKITPMYCYQCYGMIKKCPYCLIYLD